MSIPAELRYTKEHEWVRVEGNVVTIGITDFAQNNLGDVVFCELPKVGAELQQFKTFGVVESVKAVSDLYAPVSGKVSAVNASLADNPAQLNTDPFGAAWLLKIELSKPEELDVLLDAAAYEQLTAEH